MEITEKDFKEMGEQIAQSVKTKIEGKLLCAPLMNIAHVLEKTFPQHVSTHEWYSDILVQFACKTIEEVTPILRYITNVAGLNQEKPKEQNDLVADWFFPKMQIRVTFSGKCKMVQIGEKVIPEHTEPIMQMQCEDSPPSGEENSTDLPF